MIVPIVGGGAADITLKSIDSQEAGNALKAVGFNERLAGELGKLARLDCSQPGEGLPKNLQASPTAMGNGSHFTPPTARTPRRKMGRAIGRGHLDRQQSIWSRI